MNDRARNGHRNVLMTVGTATDTTSGHNGFYCGSSKLPCQATQDGPHATRPLRGAAAQINQSEITQKKIAAIKELW